MSGEKSILLIEDNQQDELLTIRALQKNNISNKVVVARDGEEACKVLFGSAGSVETHSRSKSELPQVVLLDLKLPKIDGLEVLRRIRADTRTRRLPVVILTTSAEDKDIIQGYDSGANSYVRKPVDFNEFSEAIRNLGLYWLILNRTAIKDTQI